MYKFEKLQVWQLSLDYLDVCYEVSSSLPEYEKFNLISQLRRAATSISLNIAEGSTGQSNKEQCKFLGYALRSCIETIAICQIISRRQFLNNAELENQQKTQAEILIKKLQSFRNSL